MKIIHCADLHIDNKNFNRFSPEKRNLKRNQLLQNFVDMVDFAEKNKVTAILLCGDIFQDTKILKKSLKIFQDTIISHPNITFFYIWGNHDEKIEIFDKKPLNFVVFKEHFSKVDFGDICVGGISYTRQINPLVFDEIYFQKEDFNILMMHGPVLGGDIYSEPIPIKKFASKNVDYLALGHIHKKIEGKLDKRGMWSFSGCLESNSYSYLGEDYGFYLIDIQDRKMKRDFISFAKYKYRIVEIDISDVKTFESLRTKVDESMKSFNSFDIVKVVFVGKRKEGEELNLNFPFEKYKNIVFHLEIEDNSKIVFDLEKYANEQLSLKAEFIKEVMLDKDLTEEEKQQICLVGLEALKGEDISL